MRYLKLKTASDIKKELDEEYEYYKNLFSDLSIDELLSILYSNRDELPLSVVNLLCSFIVSRAVFSFLIFIFFLSYDLFFFYFFFIYLL